jgi:AAA ATPase domain
MVAEDNNLLLPVTFSLIWIRINGFSFTHLVGILLLRYFFLVKINFKDHAQITANVVSHLLDKNHERYPVDDSNSNVKPFVKCHCLVGRESELEIHDRPFHQVDISQISEVVMIHGPSGIGKTRLVDAFLRALNG